MRFCVEKSGFFMVNIKSVMIPRPGGCVCQSDLRQIMRTIVYIFRAVDISTTFFLVNIKSEIYGGKCYQQLLLANLQI